MYRHHLRQADHVLKAIGLAHTVRDLKNKFPDDGNINHHTLIQILEKLRKDGYIQIVGANNQYKDSEPNDGNYVRKTFEGEVFLDRGGYRKELLDKRMKNIATAGNIVLLLVIGFLQVYYQGCKDDLNRTNQVHQISPPEYNDADTVSAVF